MDLFETHLEIVSRTADSLKAVCPFPDLHDGGQDTDASFHVDLKTGRWKCYGCGSSGTKGSFAKLFSGGRVPQSDIERATTQLLGKPAGAAAREYLLSYKLLLPSTMVRYSIGLHYDHPISWIWIPIYDENGMCVNVRQFNWERAERTPKYKHYDKGFGHAFCWPIPDRGEKQVVICEGEFKALVLRQAGFNATSLPSGADSFHRRHISQFSGKDVYVLLDSGSAGQKATTAIAETLQGYAASVRSVLVPHVEGVEKEKLDDVIDWLRSKGARTSTSQRELVQSLLDGAELVDPFSDFIDVPLSKSTNAEFTKQKIHSAVRVVGKDLAPYTLPKIARFTCSPADKGPCSGCQYAESGEAEILLGPDSPKLLISLAGKPDAAVHKILKGLARLPERGCNARLTIDEYQNLEEVTVTPSVRSAEFGDHVMRQVWYLGEGLKANSEYGFYGVSTPSPTDQHATQLVIRADPAQSDLDSWVNAWHEELKVFQDFDYETFSRDIEYNVARNLRGIRDCLEAYDYVWHSALTFDFDGYRIRKGYAEALILGDPRLGKTTLAEILAHHYRSGDLLSGEQVTLAGLLGSLHQVNKRWILVWGKLPQLDRRMGIIDETSGIPPEVLGLLSGVRSSGVAELVKVRTEKTYARTRLLWLSNCRRQGSQLEDYDYGVSAVKDLFGAAEDIARLDYVFTLASGDIPDDVIYSKPEPAPHVYTSDLCSKLVLWAWTRTPEQIQFEEGATKLCLSLARKMGAKYSPKIPLVKAAEQRNVLAKLAVAAAARRYSTPDGENLVVEPKHVQMAYAFLEKCWHRPSLGYAAFSKAEASANEIDEEAVVMKLLELSDPLFSVNWFMRTYRFMAQDFEVLGLDRGGAGDFLSFMAEGNCIEKCGREYRKRAPFMSLLRRLKQDRSFLASAGRRKKKGEEL